MSTLTKLPYAVNDPKTDPGMPKSGDAVVVCRPDGSTSFFLLDVDHQALVKTIAANQKITDAEFGQLDAAHKAMTLYLVSQNEKIMEALTDGERSRFLGGPGSAPAELTRRNRNSDFGESCPMPRLRSAPSSMT